MPVLSSAELAIAVDKEFYSSDCAAFTCHTFLCCECLWLSGSHSRHCRVCRKIEASSQRRVSCLGSRITHDSGSSLVSDHIKILLVSGFESRIA